MTNQTLALDDAALLEQSPDAVIYADADGAIRVWNAGAVRIFGHEAEAAIGQSLDLIIPEKAEIPARRHVNNDGFGNPQFVTG